MEVILTEKVVNLGGIGDVVKPKSGFVRNYLLPRKKAVLATKENRAHFEAKRAELEKHAEEQFQAAQKRAEKMNNLIVSIAVRAGEGGKLFGSIGTKDIAHAVCMTGNDVEKSEVWLPSGPIRVVGEYTIEIGLHPDVVATIICKVVPEQA
jgi:large subunit ribosomal protein L9